MNSKEKFEMHILKINILLTTPPPLSPYPCYIEYSLNYPTYLKPIIYAGYNNILKYFLFSLYLDEYGTISLKYIISITLQK